MWTKAPFIPSDSLEGIVKEPIKISGIERRESKPEQFKLLSNKYPPVLVLKKENYYLPILMQDKHSGLVILPYKILNEIFKSPEKFFMYWHFIFGLLQIFLLESFLKKRFEGGTIVLLGTFLFAINPLQVFNYAFFITELVTFSLFLYIINIVEDKKVKKDRPLGAKLGLLMAVGFWSRVNFIWLAASLIPSMKKFNKRTWFYIILSGSMLTIPYLLIIDYSRMREAVTGIYGEGGEFFTNVFHFIALFFSSPNSLSFLWSDQFHRDMKYAGINFLMKDIAFVFGSLVVMIWFFLSRKKLFKEVRIYFISLCSFLATMMISLGGSSTYANYIYPIGLWASVIFAIIFMDMMKNGLRGRIFAVLLGVSLVINTSLTYFNLYKNGPVAWHNMNLAKKVLEKVGERQLYTLGESDIGKYEYLSQGMVQPINLFYEISNRKYKSLNDLLSKLGNGTIAVPLVDEWSGWFFAWGELVPSNIIKYSKYHNVEILNQSFVQNNGKNIYWIFDFKKRQESGK